MAATFSPDWSAAELAKAVCDDLVGKGKLKEKPAFIRTDREAKIAKIFEAAALDGSKMATLSGRDVEVAVRNATEGEAWVDDVQTSLKGMLSEEASKSTKHEESAEVKEVREKMLGLARDNADPDGKPPPNPAGPGGDRRGERRSGGDRGDDEAYGSFGGRRGGGGQDQQCFNCGGYGHISRDCPEPRNDDRGGGQGGGGYGGDRECYNWCARAPAAPRAPAHPRAPPQPAPPHPPHPERATLPPTSPPVRPRQWPDWAHLA